MSFIDLLLTVPSDFIKWAWERLAEMPQFLRDAPAKVLRDDLFAALVLLFVIFVRLTARWFSLQPVRSAYRRPYFRKAKRLELYQRRTIRRELLRALRHSEKSIRTPEVAQTCSSIRIAVWMTLKNSEADKTFVAPHKCDIVTNLHLLVAKSLEPSNQNIITRFLVSARWEEHAEHLREIDAYLKQFSALSPVFVRNSASDAKRTQPTFADTISSSTGAVILADFTTDSAALSTTTIAVWHERIWFGKSHTGSDDGMIDITDSNEEAENYDSGPQSDSSDQGVQDDRGGDPSAPRPNGVQKLPASLMTPYEIAASKETNQVAAATKRLGSFNGRIPTLLRAEVTRSLGLEEPILLLITGETDYNATEERCQKAERKDHPDPASSDNSSNTTTYGPRACKKLPYLPKGSTFSSYYPIKFGARYYSGSTSNLYDRANLVLPRTNLGAQRSERVVVPKNPSRAYQLNGKVTFICRTRNDEGDFDSFAVLMNRSMANENGFGVAATTAGGVLMLPVPKSLGDGNRFGALDPIPGIRREITEELGLKDVDYSISVHAVVQHNSRPRPRMKEGKLAVDNGELTSTCLAIAHTVLSPEALSARRFTGSASAGLAEADGLISIPLGKNAEEFHETVTTGSYCERCSKFFSDPSSAPEKHCDKELTLLTDNVEQMALVSLAYCSAVIHDVKSTKSAWQSAALWTEPHSDLTESELRGYKYSRVCVDPQALHLSGEFGKALKAIRGRQYEQFLERSDRNAWR